MDLFSTNNLVATVEDLRSRPVDLSLLSVFFPNIIEEESEEIHFDTENKPRRIAPFVHPYSEAKPMEEQGYNTATFKPAYVKPLTHWKPDQAQKRVMGEPLTGNQSPAQRMQTRISMCLGDHIATIRRRKEVMAGEALRLGQVTVSGEGYATQVVDFQRDPALTVDLAGGGSEWDDPGATPVEDVEDWRALVLQKSGAAPSDAVFTPSAWKLYRADPLFEKSVDLRRGGDDASNLISRVQTGLFQMGTQGGMRLWLYYDWYVDENDVEQPIIPDNTVLLGSGAIEGRQVQGAIQDHTVGLVATEFAPKSWTQENPSVRYLMTQSAPLVVPFRANASFSANVT